MGAALPTIQKIARVGVDSDLLHDVIHGPASGPASWVQTEGGAIPTAANAIQAVQSESNSSIAAIQAHAAASIAAIQAVSASVGYQVPVAYAAGLSMTTANQTVAYSGQVYAPILSSLPFATSGTFEAAKFRLIQGLAATDLVAAGGAALVGYSPNYAGDPSVTVQAKLSSLDAVFRVPSVTPGNSHFDVIVPNPGTFIDNVASIQNLSDNGVIHGNAAWRFVDHLGKERAAHGYSRVDTSTPGGWYPNLAFVECGNLHPGDPDDTDFAVVVTHAAGASNFPGTSLKAIEVVASTGDINFRTQSPYFPGAVNMGAIGEPEELSIGMASSKARLRERDNADNFAITTNAISHNGTQDNPAQSSWEVSFGAAYDNFWIGRSPAGVSAPTQMPGLLVLDKIGRLMIGQVAPSPGADGMFSVTNNYGLSAITAKSTNGLPPILAYNNGASGDQPLIDFGTDASYTRRGGISFNRSSGAIQYNTTSDGSLKTKLGKAPVEISKNLVMTSPISEWYWTADPGKKKQIGPIAQELYASGFSGAVHVGGQRDVLENVYEDVMGDVEVPVYEDFITDKYVVEDTPVVQPDGTTKSEPVRKVYPGQGPSVKVQTGTKTLNTKVGQKLVGTKKVGEEYDPWCVDKTAFVFHLVVLAQDHENRIAALESLVQQQAKVIDALSEKLQ